MFYKFTSASYITSKSKPIKNEELIWGDKVKILKTVSINEIKKGFYGLACENIWWSCLLTKYPIFKSR